MRDVAEPLYKDKGPGISIVGGNFVLPDGGGARGTKILSAAVSSAGGSGVTWSSSNPGIAAVDPDTGEVVSGSPGTATITAALADFPSIIHSVTITVQRRSWLTDIGGITALPNGEIVNINVGAGRFTVRAEGQIQSNTQIFGFVYLPVSGDFTMTVKLDSVSFGLLGGGVSSIAGLIAISQAGITQDSAGNLLDYPATTSLLYAGVVLRPIASQDYQWFRYARFASGSDYASVQIGTDTPTNAQLSSPGRWIKLSRQGDVFTMAYSANGGISWESETATVVIGSVYAGIWIAGGASTPAVTTAGFSEWSIVAGNGNATQAQLNTTEARISLAYLE